MPVAHFDRQSPGTGGNCGAYALAEAMIFNLQNNPNSLVWGQLGTEISRYYAVETADVMLGRIRNYRFDLPVEKDDNSSRVLAMFNTVFRGCLVKSHLDSLRQIKGLIQGARSRVAGDAFEDEVFKIIQGDLFLSLILSAFNTLYSNPQASDADLNRDLGHCPGFRREIAALVDQVRRVEGQLNSLSADKLEMYRACFAVCSLLGVSLGQSAASAESAELPEPLRTLVNVKSMIALSSEDLGAIVACFSYQNLDLLTAADQLPRSLPNVLCLRHTGSHWNAVISPFPPLEDPTTTIPEITTGLASKYMVHGVLSIEEISKVFTSYFSNPSNPFGRLFTLLKRHHCAAAQRIVAACNPDGARLESVARCIHEEMTAVAATCKREGDFWARCEYVVRRGPELFPEFSSLPAPSSAATPGSLVQRS